LAFTLYSCSTRQYQVLFQQKSLVSDTTYNKTDSGGNYRIKPQDIIQVRNLQDGNVLFTPIAGVSGSVKNNILAGNGVEGEGPTFQVDDEGMVMLPAIGRIKIAGFTRVEAQKIVDSAYRKEVFTNPIIELKIVSLKVILFGETKTQGSLPLTKEHMTLVEMIGSAGGLTEKADETHIRIIRGTSRNPKVIMVDLSNIQSINDPKTILQNGDIIYVSQNKRANRNENFQNFSSSTFQPFLLIVNAALIVFTLIRR
jgi:polysaccharide export outer membrane protein